MFWQALLIIHFAATLFMVGLVAAVQVLHYPLLAEAHDIPATCRRHVQRAGPLIAPPMLLEAVSGLLLLASPFSSPLLIVSLLLLAAIWASTFTIQVPLHKQLIAGRGDSRRLAARLVATNWLRTIAWFFRAACLAPLLISAVGALHGEWLPKELQRDLKSSVKF